MTSWPPPSAFGFNAGTFPSWRPGQPEAIAAVIDAPTRFRALVLPTGFGKSLTYTAVPAIQHATAAMLTSTRALQTQLGRDYGGHAGFVSVQGQTNYRCQALQPGGEHAARYGAPWLTEATVDHGPCHFGVDCSLKAGGCAYYDTVRAAQSADVLVTNYAWWLTLSRQPHLRVRPEWLILDEAHHAPDELAEALGATVPAKLVDQVLHERLPHAGAYDAVDWVRWAQRQTAVLGNRLATAQPRNREGIAAVRRGQHLLRELERIAGLDPALLIVRDDPEGVRFDLVWAAPYAEPHLFRGVPNVVLTSATMTRHTAELLGVIEKDLTFYEAGDGFPLSRRPVYVCPAKGSPWDEKGIRVDHRLTREHREALVAHIDALLDGRGDRKGIIHTTSYERRDWLLAHSRHAGRMLTHGRGDTADVIANFRARPASSGTVLVSPSVTTGYDFPYQEAEYQILLKIPFPDSRDPITATRSLIDTRYGSHVAMQTLVQTCGRIMRAADDLGETFIVDAHARWFLPRNSDLAPKWFRRAVTVLAAGQVPTPPRRLASRTDSTRER